jgi:prepilin-type N-terminal cleavage/methylation domain-containing protein/prepilin-type processing-associated H-X9-DG protein
MRIEYCPRCRGIDVVSARPGFTLVELLVCIAILSILAGLLLPTIRRARTSAEDVRSLADLRQVGQQLTAYAQENRGSMCPRVAQGLGGLKPWLPWPEALTGRERPDGFRSSLAIDGQEWLSFMISESAALDRLRWDGKSWGPKGLGLAYDRSKTIWVSDNYPSTNQDIAGVPMPSSIFPYRMPARHSGGRCGYLWVDGHVSLEAISWPDVCQYWYPFGWR